MWELTFSQSTGSQNHTGQGGKSPGLVNPPATWRSGAYRVLSRPLSHSLDNIRDQAAIIINITLYKMEEEMETHSSVLAWSISWTEQPGMLQSMGSQGIGQN